MCANPEDKATLRYGQLDTFGITYVFNGSPLDHDASPALSGSGRISVTMPNTVSVSVYLQPSDDVTDFVAMALSFYINATDEVRVDFVNQGTIVASQTVSSGLGINH